MKLAAWLGSASFALCVATAAQAADKFLIQLDDIDPSGKVVGNTYQNGVLIQSVVFCCETIKSGYGLWNGAALVADFTNQFNFYEPGTSILSDTSEISGHAGDHFITFTFQSDGGPSPLVPYVNGINLFETGGWQDIVFAGVVDNGDFYQIQMRSDLDVPEPATWALMLVGFGGLGIALRARRRTAVPA